MKLKINKDLLKRIKNLKKENKEIKKILKKENDKEMILFLKEEINKNKIEIKKNKKKIKKKKEKVMLEIKIGVGGVESLIFMNDLKKMYEKYIDKMKWKKKIISENYNKNEEKKEFLITIKGKNVYKKLKYESGVHRVQRTPKTENKGRIHTSTCRVAIYKISKIKKNKINKKNLKIETFKSSGAGGQHVNKTNSAVRVVHIPSGIKVECQKERSQHKNKKYALESIENKLSIKNKEEKKNFLRNKKKTLLGNGERAEKIRTYNYKENRITDHRFKINLNNLDEILNGNLEKLTKKFKNVKKQKYKNK